MNTITFFTVDEDGRIKEADKPIEEYSWDCWPAVYKLVLYAGPDATIFKLTEKGWEKYWTHND